MYIGMKRLNTDPASKLQVCVCVCLLEDAVHVRVHCVFFCPRHTHIGEFIDMQRHALRLVAAQHFGFEASQLWTVQNPSSAGHGSAALAEYAAP